MTAAAQTASTGLLRYVAARSLRAALTVFGVVSLLFVLVHLLPGDPVSAILGDQASPEDRAALRSALRLDRPLLEQYLAFLGDVGNGSLGHSFRERGRSVASLIGEVLPYTASLAAGALVVALAIALPLGALAAVRRGTRWDAAASSFALFASAVPNIWLGPLLVLCFGVWLRVLPMPGEEPSLSSSILPVLT
ncbi:MAG TPA: ABC transporter permease, partial [Polyangiales bacterium]|nr:ABC transporter permease [Polyangiales bacterium]